MKKILYFLGLGALVLVFAGCELLFDGVGLSPDDSEEVVGEPVKITGEWTIMVWLDGDNDLEWSAINDINEMEEGLYQAKQVNSSIEDKITIVVQFDRADGYSEGGYDGTSTNWIDTRRYLIKPDSITDDNIIRSERLDESTPLGEINMGDPANLKAFISYCKANYTAENYALIFWNHGGGVRSYVSEPAAEERITKSVANGLPGNTPPQKAVCWDEGNGDDALYVGEITDVLTLSESVDLLGFDACLMGMAEVAYEYRPKANGFGADYMAASVATEQGDGWEYQNLFSCFTGEPEGTTDPADLFAKAIVTEYQRAFSSSSKQTMAAYDLSHIGGVKTALDNLAATLDSPTGKTNSEAARDAAMYYFDKADVSQWVSYPHFDIYDYAEKMSSAGLRDAVSNCVISSWGQGYSGFNSGRNGLGFFYPIGDALVSDGDDTTVDHPLYAYQWWYTSEDTSIWWPGEHYYGKLDFCNSNADGVVEGWRELLEYWFDNGTSYTPSSH